MGHLILAEGNLSKIYPECEFLAADPSSEINERLVRDGLHGVFVQAAIGGESASNIAQNVLDGGDFKIISNGRRTYIFLILRSDNHN